MTEVKKTDAFYFFFFFFRDTDVEILSESRDEGDLEMHDERGSGTDMSMRKVPVETDDELTR